MNEQYAFCERCIAQTVALLNDRQHGRHPNEGDIRRRRKIGRIALRGLYDALRQAFLTPIDREDLWRLCLLSERVLFAAEEMILRQQPFNAAAVEIVARLQRSVTAFPDFRSDENFFDQATELQALLATVYPRNALSDACGRLADELLFAALKNE